MGLGLVFTERKVNKLIENAMYGFKSDILSIKNKVHDLETKVTHLMKSRNETDLFEINKELNLVKSQLDSLQNVFGTIDVDDVSIEVDAKRNNVAFKIGDFEFSSNINLVK
jgi:hypothetical protein